MKWAGKLMYYCKKLHEMVALPGGIAVSLSIVCLSVCEEKESFSVL